MKFKYENRVLHESVGNRKKDQFKGYMIKNILKTKIVKKV